MVGDDLDSDMEQEIEDSDVVELTPQPGQIHKKAGHKHPTAKHDHKAKVSRKSRVQNFSVDEKKKLAVAVKHFPEIWDLTNHQHQNNNAVNLAWTKIATELSKTGKFCTKLIITSLVFVSATLILFNSR